VIESQQPVVADGPLRGPPLNRSVIQMICASIDGREFFRLPEKVIVIVFSPLFCLLPVACCLLAVFSAVMTAE